MSAPRKIRVGIVGSGFGAVVHVPAFKIHPAFELVAIASPKRADEVAMREGIPQAFRSVEEMLAGAAIDLISVTSPPFDHHRSVLAANAAGKHILCEKPFALSVAQAEEMLAAAERAGIVAALHFEFRYVPMIADLIAMCRQGRFGRLHQIDFTRLGRDLLARTESNARGWWFDRRKGGGVANAIMPHIFDTVSQLAGREPKNTIGLLRTANARRKDAEGEFESTVADGAFAYVDYGDGLIARCCNDSTSVLNAVNLGIHGEEGSAVGAGSWLTDLSVELVKDGERHPYTAKPSPYEEHGKEIPNIALLLSLLGDVEQSIRTGQSNVPTFRDGLVVQRQLEAIGYPSKG